MLLIELFRHKLIFPFFHRTDRSSAPGRWFGPGWVPQLFRIRVSQAAGTWEPFQAPLLTNYMNIRSLYRFHKTLFLSLFLYTEFVITHDDHTQIDW